MNRIHVGLQFFLNQTYKLVLITVKWAGGVCIIGIAAAAAVTFVAHLCGWGSVDRECGTSCEN